MAIAEANKVGKRGMVVLPAKLRKRFGIEEGSYVIAEERDEGILIRPAAVTPVEMYTPERVAEFLLGSAVDERSYAEAVAAVRKMGLDPKQKRRAGTSRPCARTDSMTCGASRRSSSG